MHRLELAAFGSLHDLTLVPGPDPLPGPGEVVVAVEAAGVNFVDALIVQGAYQFTPPLPYTPGTEVAGVVAAVSDDVEELHPGQRVLALPASGGYATHVVVPAAAVVPLPEALTSGRAAGLVQSYVTALYALRHRARVQAGEWVAVLGAGGGVGLATTDLATSLGARVVACASSQEKLDRATSAGAVAKVD
jgi:NADPH:quinone reductase